MIKQQNEAVGLIKQLPRNKASNASNAQQSKQRTHNKRKKDKRQTLMEITYSIYKVITLHCRANGTQNTADSLRGSSSLAFK